MYEDLKEEIRVLKLAILSNEKRIQELEKITEHLRPK
jgi:hypothetical protein